LTLQNEPVLAEQK